MATGVTETPAAMQVARNRFFMELGGEGEKMRWAVRAGVFDQSKRRHNFHLNEKYFFWHFFNYPISINAYKHLIFDQLVFIKKATS